MKIGWGKSGVEARSAGRAPEAMFRRVFVVVWLENQGNVRLVFERLEDARRYAEQRVAQDVDEAKIFEVGLMEETMQYEYRVNLAVSEALENKAGRLVEIVAAA